MITRERPFVVTLVRKRKVVWIRHYARLGTALRKIGELAPEEGQPGDVFELAHSGTGKQLGEAKLTLRDGKMNMLTTWPW